jgi:hypothetical protein
MGVGAIARRQVSRPSRGAGTASGWVRNRTSGQVPAPLRGVGNFSSRAHRGFDRFAAFTPGYPPARLRRFRRPRRPGRTLVDLPRAARFRAGEAGGRGAGEGPAVFASLDAPATVWNRSAVRILPVMGLRESKIRRLLVE